MFVGRPAGMVGFRTHTFTRIGSIMDKKHSMYLQPIVTQYLVCNKSEIWP